MNPYAAPATFSHEKMTFGGFEVRGKRLAAQDGAVLPARCIKTNQEVTPGENGRIKRIKLAWSNPWWALLILVPYCGILIYIIAALSTRKSGSITIHLSNQAIKRKRIWLSSLVILAIAIPAIAFNIDFELSELGELAVVGSFIGAIFLLLIAALSIRYLTPVGSKEGWFLIRGFNQELLNDIASRKI